MAAHHASRETAADAALRPGLDELAAGVAEATAQLAAALRGAAARAAGTETADAQAADARPAGAPQPPRLGSLPPLRAQQQAIRLRPETGETGLAGKDPSRPAWPGSEAAGLFAATDGLVDAINTAAHVLGG